jgi:hypothetical protein
VTAKRSTSAKSARTLTLKGDPVDLSDDVPMIVAASVDLAIFQDLEELRISSNSNGNLEEYEFENNCEWLIVK